MKILALALAAATAGSAALAADAPQTRRPTHGSN